jgi:glycosidase
MNQAEACNDFVLCIKIFVFLFTVADLGIYRNALAELNDWRRKVIYFALLDRFSNGNSWNDKSHGDQVCNKPFDMHAYQGGDLAGLSHKIDYISQLGADTIWISPLYKGVAAKEGPRFLESITPGISASDTHRRYLLAITALLTLPGIPQIYYGNEIGLKSVANLLHTIRLLPTSIS